MIISETNSCFVKNKKEITTTGVGVIQTLCAICQIPKSRLDS